MAVTNYQAIAPSEDDDDNKFEDDFEEEEEDTVPAASKPLQIKRDAVHFGLRLGIILTVASCFALVPINLETGRLWPSGSWVVITALMVSWFPRLDAASVIEKSFQRTIGTLTGGTIAVICGLLSLHMPGAMDEVLSPSQGLFLAGCMLLIPFLVGFTTMQFPFPSWTGSKNKKTILEQYSYACCLCLLTFTIALFPFYDNKDHPKWRKGVWRVVNVAIGCLLGALGSILVLPRSTSKILHQKIQKQCQLAGEAGEAVLHAATDAFAGNMTPLPLADQLLESLAHRKSRIHMSLLRQSFHRVNKAILDVEGDVALEKYEAALQDWRATKSLFSLLHYDPFQYVRNSQRVASFRNECANTLARALRVQTTVVLMDDFIRNDVQDMTNDMFDDDVLSLFTEIGTITRRMLTIPHHPEKNEAARKQLTRRLAIVRQLIAQLQLVAVLPQNNDPTDPSLDATLHSLRNSMAWSSRHEPQQKRVSLSFVHFFDPEQQAQHRDHDGQQQVNTTTVNYDGAIFFLKTLEHLIVRCRALYDAWQEVERVS